MVFESYGILFFSFCHSYPQARQNCCHGPNTAHVILKVREDAVNDVLCAPLSNYRQGASKLTGISNKTYRMTGEWSPRALEAMKRQDEAKRL